KSHARYLCQESSRSVAQVSLVHPFIIVCRQRNSHLSQASQGETGRRTFPRVLISPNVLCRDWRHIMSRSAIIYPSAAFAPGMVLAPAVSAAWAQMPTTPTRPSMTTMQRPTNNMMMVNHHPMTPVPPIHHFDHDFRHHPWWWNKNPWWWWSNNPWIWATMY